MRNARRTGWSLGTWTVAGTLVLLAAKSGVCGDARPNLEGSWTINTYLTGQLMKDQAEQRPAASNQSGHGHRGGGGRSGEGTSPGDSPNTGGDKAKKHEDNSRPELGSIDTLTIAQTATDVTITDQGGHSRVFKTDGSKVKDDKGRGGPAQVRASWDGDGSLVIETKPEKGPRRTETYMVADDRKHLYVTISWYSSEGSGSMLRAYDPLPPAAAKTSPPP
jgi:hypothetical protein